MAETNGVMGLIQVKELKKHYWDGSRKLDVLQGVDLEVSAGEMIAVMGRSGSGKSTLLNILAGLDRADGGKYIFEGKCITGLNPHQLADFRRRNIGYIVQNYALIDSKNVFDNIALPLRYGGLSRREIAIKVNVMLDMLEIKQLQNKSPDHLSGGERQRVAIARALVQDPKCILADEPTGSLDEQTEEEILSIFRRLNQQGKAIIIVTHDRQVADICAKVYHIKSGKCDYVETL